MSIQKRPRGRPLGSGKNTDLQYLAQVADLQVRDPSVTSPTMAMKQVMKSHQGTETDQTLLRRWQGKWKTHKSALLAEAQDRTRPRPSGAFKEFTYTNANIESAIKSVQNLPSLKQWDEAIKTIQNLPTLKQWDETIKAIQNSSTLKQWNETIKAIQNSPALKRWDEAIKAIQNSPTLTQWAEASKAIETAPTLKAIRDFQNSPAWKGIDNIERIPPIGRFNI